jgi:MYXO-CTERM domain-containing protein
MPRRHLEIMLALLCLAATDAWGQQGKVVDQQRNAAGEGYSVLRVWGSAEEMGYAQGYIFAKESVAAVDEIKKTIGLLYGTARQAMTAAVWKPAAVEGELTGMVAGIKAAVPGSTIDAADLKVANTYGDWAYIACRSHSSWGSFVSGPTRTLSTRRLDFGAPLATVKHHVLIARIPSDGSPRWLSLGWVANVTSVTGVNEHGTLASLHDYNTKFVLGAHLPRSALVRHALTLVKGLPVEAHLDAVYSELQKTSVMTGTFLNYYVPEGHGGVITCPPGLPCNKKRVAQSDYFGGAVLITTNDETDGHSTPDGGDFMGSYYQKGGPKSIADHHALMGHNGMHLLSVDYRGPGDMTIWAEGKLSSGVTPTIKVEWKTLFAAPTPVGDGGTGPSADAANPGDAGVSARDAATDLSIALDATQSGDGDGGGCGCAIDRAGGGGVPLLLMLALVALGVLRGRRRRGRSSRCSRSSSAPGWARVRPRPSSSPSTPTSPPRTSSTASRTSGWAGCGSTSTGSRSSPARGATTGRSSTT